MQLIQVQSLGGEDPLEKEMATHSSILAWRIPWTEELGRLQSMGSQRVGHNWATKTHTPGEGNGNPSQYSCLGSPTHRGVWRATAHGASKSRTQLSKHTHTHLLCPNLTLPESASRVCFLRMLPQDTETAEYSSFYDEQAWDWSQPCNFLKAWCWVGNATGSSVFLQSKIKNNVCYRFDCESL